MSNPHGQYPQPPAQPGVIGAPPPTQGSNGLATAGFVLALLGLLGSWIPLLNVFAILLGLLGVILAGIGLARSKKVNAGKGLSIAGLVLGVLAIVFSVVVNSAFVDAVDEATGNTVDSAPGGSDDSSDDAESDGSDSNEAGSTRDNPVPIGSAITGGDWTVTVNSVEPTDSDSLGATAKDGSILLLVNTTATYNGTDEQGSPPFSSIGYVTPDGKSFDSLDGSTLFVADDEFDSLTTVYEGGTVTGDQIVEVPEQNWQAGVLAISPDLLSDDSFVAVR